MKTRKEDCLACDGLGTLRDSSKDSMEWGPGEMVCPACNGNCVVNEGEQVDLDDLPSEEDLRIWIGRFKKRWRADDE